MNPILNFFAVYYKLLIFIAIVLVIVVRTWRRGYFWKVRKTGRKLQFKQFMGLWKDGVEGITPLQQARALVWGTWITLAGILLGIITTAFVRIKGVWWWVEVLLFGSLVITSMQQVGMLQRYWKHLAVAKTLEDLNKGMESEIPETEN